MNRDQTTTQWYRTWPVLGLFLALLFVAACVAPNPETGSQRVAQRPVATETSALTASPTPVPTMDRAGVAGDQENRNDNPTHTSTPTPTPTVTPTATPVPVSIPQDAATLAGTVQNFVPVGHTALGAIGWHAGLALKDHCAYVGNRNRPAVAIVDVGDPARPTPVGEIPFGRGAQPVEVRTLPERNLLVVADLATGPHLHTFDVSNCTQPVPLGSFTLPRVPHEFFLWSDGSSVLAYVATFSHPDLVVVDLADPAAPQELWRWSAQAEGVPGLLHSISLSPDGRRAYLSMWDGGFLIARVTDTGLVLHREADPGVPVLWFQNTHSAVPLQDPRFVLLTSEIYTCPFGGVAIVDAADPLHPQIISQMLLPENRCPNLPQADAVFTAHNPLVVGNLVFLSWYGGGLQVLDLSDPYHPQRAGQFVPSGDGAASGSYVGTYPVQTWSYPILRAGLIYVVDIQSGLYVVRYTGPGAEVISTVPWAEGNVTIAPVR